VAPLCSRGCAVGNTAVHDRQVSSYISLRCAQAKNPADTNKTPADCTPVPSPSRRVHQSGVPLTGVLKCPLLRVLTPEFSAVRCRRDPTQPTVGPDSRRSVPGVGSGVTDVSSKGLLPQLTDVLYALTESHERLLFKLQALRRVHNDGPIGSGVLQSFRLGSTAAALPDLAERRTPDPLAEMVDTANGARGDLSVDALTSNGVGTPILTEFDVRPAVGYGPEPQSEGEATPPPPPASEAVGRQLGTDRAAPPDLLPRPEGIQVELSGPTEEGSADRNYNFFDELDARLTHIQDPEHGSGRRGPS
jgi:hypothetical protein